MLFPVTNPLFQTQIFTALLVVTLLLSSRRKTEETTLSPSVSTELKGFAIMGILLAHIGYYLAQDHAFLFPLSITAGIGVDLFLFLSGYGLTSSMLKKDSSIASFYQRRVSRVFIPLWILLAILFLADHFVLHLHYSWLTVMESFLGLFPRADLYESLNAPLWYLTLLLFYYLLFPLVFSKKRPILSALILATAGLFCILLPLPVSGGVFATYRSHLFAFPTGVLAAACIFQPHHFLRRLVEKVKHFFQERPHITKVARWSVLAVLVFLFGYTALYSGVGQGPWIEQKISLFSMACALGIFVLKPIQNHFLLLIGTYSYEIYLLHWPLMYRYDFVYKWLPPGMATFVYLFVLLGIAWLFQKLSQLVLKHAKIGS